jgi:hypothetical protein
MSARRSPRTGPHRPIRPRALIAWLVVAADLTAVLLAQLYNATPLISIVLVSVIASFVIVGATLVTRVAANPIGWILWSSGSFMAWSIAANTYANYSLDRFGGTLPGTVAVALLSNVGIIPILTVTAIFVPLLFPDGHLPSPGWRAVGWFAGVAIGLTTFISALKPGPMSNGVAIENPIASTGVGTLPEVVGVAVVGALFLSFGLAVGSVVWRYRHGAPVERQQTRWFASAALVMLVAVAVGFSGVGPLAEGGWLLVLAGLALMPIAIGVAILRYRLYDLDRLVSRTISYGLLTGALLAAYAALILVLEGPLGAITTGNTLAVALSTLVVAALFQPVRQRIQRVVDHRFDRARFDADRTAAAFSERLRDEIDIATLTADLDSTVRVALRPATIGLWLRGIAR